MKKTEIQPLEDFCADPQVHVRIGQMRGYIARRAQNGADMWIRKLGRRIYVDVEKFFEWTKREGKK